MKLKSLKSQNDHDYDDLNKVFGIFHREFGQIAPKKLTIFKAFVEITDNGSTYDFDSFHEITMAVSPSALCARARKVAYTEKKFARRFLFGENEINVTF